MCGYKFCRYERRYKTVYVPKTVCTTVPVWYQVTKIGDGCGCGGSSGCGCSNDCGYYYNCNSNNCCECNSDENYCD